MSKAPKPLDWSSAFTLTYDAWQRLVQVKSGSTTVAIYVYDGQNRRITKTTGTTTRHYYYSNQWQILEERLNTATIADRQFVWGLMALDNLILRDRGTERFYSLQDVFSCTAIVDTSGTIQ
jgi:YD repeat-containing protein